MSVRSLLAAIIVCVIGMHLPAAEHTMADFSDASWTQIEWELRYLPSGRRAPGCSAVIRDDTLEIRVDLRSAPSDTTGLAVVIRGDSPAVVPNVGVWKSLTAEMSVIGDRTQMAVVLRDSGLQETVLRFGSVESERFREYQMVNPRYIDQVRDRSIRRRPHYPESVPVQTLQGFVFGMTDSGLTGLRVVRVRTISMEYDPAYLE